MRFRHEVLQAARLELGLTQEALAQSLDVAVRTYRRYESGAVNEGGFTLRNASRRGLLERMNAELGTSLAELLETTSGSSPRHVLQPARHFVGRRDEVAALEAFQAQGAPGVLAIVGVGGSGKTALAERFLASHRPQLVYSLYEDRRVAPFLEAVADLDTDARPLVVLDGLEVVQVAFEDGFAHGEITVPPLRDWLRSVAGGGTNVQLITTSRFPIVDLDAFTGRGYEVLALGPLGDADVDELLRAWGVSDPATLRPLAGGHALSTAMLGSYVGGFLNGRPLAQWGFDDAVSDDPMARRLQTVLTSYLSALPHATVAVLRQLADASVGASILDDRDRVHLRRLVRLGLVFTLGDERFAMHPFVRDALRSPVDEQATLTRIPGVARSEASALLRAESELVSALDDDEILKAVRLYREELGGFDQLGLKLGAYAIGRRVLAQLEPRLEGLAHALGRRSIANLIYEQGLYSGALGDLAHALRCYSRVSDQTELDAAIRTTALRAKAYSERLLGNLSDAFRTIEAAIEIAESAGERTHAGRGHALRGAILGDAGEFDDARAAFATSESLTGPMVARRSLWRAEFDLRVGDPNAARVRTLANLEVCRRLGWAGHVAHCEAVLGFAALADNRGDARAHLGRLLEWTEPSSEAELVARADALEHQLDPDSNAARRLRERPSTSKLSGLFHWLDRRRLS